MRKVGRVEDGERHEMKAVLWTFILSQTFIGKRKQTEEVGKRISDRQSNPWTEVLRVKMEKPARTG
jgi:hypothetical protein